MTLISSLGNSFVGGLTSRPKRNKAMHTYHVKKGFYAIKDCFIIESGTSSLFWTIHFADEQKPISMPWKIGDDGYYRQKFNLQVR